MVSKRVYISNTRQDRKKQPLGGCRMKALFKNAENYWSNDQNTKSIDVQNQFIDQFISE